MNTFEPHLPYNDLPLLQDHSAFNDRSVLSLCQQITSALARVKTLYDALPCQQAILSILPLYEAQLNSCPVVNTPINQYLPNLTQLTRHASLDLIPDNQHLYSALRFHRALIRGSQVVQYRATCTSTALETARYIAGEDLVIRHGYGQPLLRGQREQIAYQPPVNESLLRSHLGNWEIFLHERADLHTLVRMAVGHFQLIAISPFPVANLRSSHILCQLYLIDKGLLPAPILGLSSYWLKYRRTYEDLFLNIHYKQQWKEWLEFILTATLHQTWHTEQQLIHFKQIWADTHSTVNRILPRSGKHELAALLMQKPFCATAHLVDAGIAQRQTASSYLKKLRDTGLLKEKLSGREKYYLHEKLLHLIEHNCIPEA